MKGLVVEHSAFVGTFRGEPGLDDMNVRVGSIFGLDVSRVAAAVQKFERLLHVRTALLDQEIHSEDGPKSVNQLDDVIKLCAWAHAEWVRIHPFANGNGRTARLIANCLAMRYGLPPFVQLRPRPENGYGAAGARAMQGDWKHTVPVFDHLLKEFLKN